MVENMLLFKKKSTNSCLVLNKNEQILGEIQRRRVGKHMHWCYCPIPVNTMGDLWLSNGCMREISAQMTKLYKGEI